MHNGPLLFGFGTEAFGFAAASSLECRTTHIPLSLTPASPDSRRRSPSPSSSSSDSFRTAGDRTPEGEDDDLLNLIPIDIPPKLTFKPRPRTIIKDPRLLGYQNLDFNFAKEWERLYSDSYVTPIIPLVPRRNYAAAFDPRQYAKAPKRTLTAELVTGRSKQTLDLAKIMTGMNDTHMKVTPTADMTARSKGTTNVKHGIRIVRTPGAPVSRPTRDPRRPRINVPIPKPIPPVANASRGISKRRIIFLPSRATPSKNPPLCATPPNANQIASRDLIEPVTSWIDSNPNELAQATAYPEKTTNTENKRGRGGKAPARLRKKAVSSSPTSPPPSITAPNAHRCPTHSSRRQGIKQPSRSQPLL